MTLGLLPKTSLSPEQYATGAKLAHWIERVIPCFVGNVPVEYTEALLEVLRKHRVPGTIIEEAFLILLERRIEFDFPLDRQLIAPLPPPVPPSRHGIPSPPQMRGDSKGDRQRTSRHTFEEYEYRYVLALKTNDAAGAEAILGAVLALLWSMAKSYGQAKQVSRHDKVAEWEEFNTAVSEALARARTLRTHILTLKPEEVRAMRDAPTPAARDSVTRQLAKRVTTRTVPPARRRARK